jgi:hypothetical protein
MSSPAATIPTTTEKNSFFSSVSSRVHPGTPGLQIDDLKISDLEVWGLNSHNFTNDKEQYKVIQNLISLEADIQEGQISLGNYRETLNKLQNTLRILKDREATGLNAFGLKDDIRAQITATESCLNNLKPNITTWQIFQDKLIQSHLSIEFVQKGTRYIKAILCFKRTERDLIFAKEQYKEAQELLKNYIKEKNDKYYYHPFYMKEENLDRIIELNKKREFWKSHITHLEESLKTKKFFLEYLNLYRDASTQ